MHSVIATDRILVALFEKYGAKQRPVFCGQVVQKVPHLRAQLFGKQIMLEVGSAFGWIGRGIIPLRRPRLRSKVFQNYVVANRIYKSAKFAGMFQPRAPSQRLKDPEEDFLLQIIHILGVAEAELQFCT